MFHHADAGKKPRESIWPDKLGEYLDCSSQFLRNCDLMRCSLPMSLTQLADFAGGSLTCVIGILMALFERFQSVSVLGFQC